MFSTIPAILACAAIIGTPLVILARDWRRRRLAAATSRLLLSSAKTAERVEAQLRYFASHGIAVAETQSTPRAALTGTIYLKPDPTVRVDYRVHTPKCRYGCGEVVIGLWEIAPRNGAGSGVIWQDLGRYCTTCGDWQCEDGYLQNFKAFGPLGERLMGQTNLFDVLGQPTEDPRQEWDRLEIEQTGLEAKLSAIRSRRHVLAPSLGTQMIGGPMRPELPAKTGT